MQGLGELRSEDLRLQALLKEYKYPPLPQPRSLVSQVIKDKIEGRAGDNKTEGEGEAEGKETQEGDKAEDLKK